MTELNMELRKKGVTGSEIAAVAGLNPYSSPVEVWERKVGLRDEPKDNYHMQRGRHLEAGLRAWLAERQGYEVREVPTLQSKSHPLVIASPDGAAYEKNKLVAAVELKSPTTGRDWEPPEVKADGIPIYYLPQVTWEMAVLDIDRADVAALIAGNLAVYHVHFNQRLFELLLREAEKFWHYVEKQEPPPLDHTDASKRFLEREFPRHQTDELVVADTETEGLILEYREIRAKAEELERKRKEMENLIKANIGDKAGLRGPWGKITWKATKDRTNIDLKALRAEVPEIAERYTITKPGSRVLRVYWED